MSRQSGYVAHVKTRLRALAAAVGDAANHTDEIRRYLAANILRPPRGASAYSILYGSEADDALQRASAAGSKWGLMPVAWGTLLKEARPSKSILQAGPDGRYDAPAFRAFVDVIGPSVPIQTAFAMFFVANIDDEARYQASISLNLTDDEQDVVDDTAAAFRATSHHLQPSAREWAVIIAAVNEPDPVVAVSIGAAGVPYCNAKPEESDEESGDESEGDDEDEPAEQAHRMVLGSDHTSAVIEKMRHRLMLRPCLPAERVARIAAAAALGGRSRDVATAIAHHYRLSKVQTERLQTMDSTYGVDTWSVLLSFVDGRSDSLPEQLRALEADVIPMLRYGERTAMQRASSREAALLAMHTILRQQNHWKLWLEMRTRQSHRGYTAINAYKEKIQPGIDADMARSVLACTRVLG